MQGKGLEAILWADSPVGLQGAGEDGLGLDQVKTRKRVMRGSLRACKLERPGDKGQRKGASVTECIGQGRFGLVKPVILWSEDALRDLISSPGGQLVTLRGQMLRSPE